MKILSVDNLLLNMQSGLLPKDLSKKEVEMLEKRYGSNWFTSLGYNSKEYEKPNFPVDKHGFVI